MTNPAADQSECWPSLPLSSWKDTCATLHMWTQIVGKVRLELTPLVNHWWNVPLYVTTRGLTTSRISYGQRAFEIWFDFIRHELMLETSDGVLKFMPLGPKSVADFYREFMAMLRSAGIEVKIWHMPVEIPDPIPFDQDQVHRSYDPAAVEKFWRILLSVDAVFGKFRAGFIGKSSPVHFFWGSFDLAVTRFSGRPAAASGRRPDHAGSLLARSLERRILAGWRQRQRCSLLFVHGPRARGIQRGASPSGEGVLRQASWRVPADVRRRAEVRIADGVAAGVLPEYVWGGGEACDLGPGGIGTDGLTFRRWSLAPSPSSVIQIGVLFLIDPRKIFRFKDLRVFDHFFARKILETKILFAKYSKIRTYWSAFAALR